MTRRSDPPNMRARLLDLTRRYPGLHVREAARQLGTSVALVEYHLAALVEASLVETETDQRFVRIHIARGPGRVAAADRPAMHVLRKRPCLAVVLLLLEETSLPHGAIAERLGLRKPTLSFHLRRLEEVGLVERADDGSYMLADAPRVRRLLRAHAPTPDLQDRLAELWSAFYGRD